MRRNRLWKWSRGESHAPTRIKGTHARVAVGVVFASVAAAAFALSARDASGQQGTLPVQPPTIAVGLQDGEDFRSWQYLVDYRNMSLGPVSPDPDAPPDRGHLNFQVHLTNALPMVELAISLQGPTCPFPVLWVQELNRVSGQPDSESIEVSPFRRMYIAEDDEYWFLVHGQPNLEDRYFADHRRAAGAYECVLTIALRRVYDRCSVSATVSGDVNGSFFGDVAYFNTHDQAVPVPLDPGQMGLLESLLGMAAPQPPDPNNPGPQPAQPSFADALAAWAAEDSESTPMSGRFNLSAANTLFGDGGFGGSGMFSFSAVGPGVVEPVTGGVDMPLTYVAALPGAMDDSFGGVKFLWSEGQPGGATLQLDGALENTIVGRLEADLYTERAYHPQGRRLQIRLQAKFLAQRGALRCQ